MIRKPTLKEQISSLPSLSLHMHYLLQIYTILQTCLTKYLCGFYDLLNELLFHQAALHNILSCVFCEVITEFLNITCKNIWIVGLERPAYHKKSYVANRLKTINTWHAMCAGKRNMKSSLMKPDVVEGTG